MLRGERVLLRAETRADVEALYPMEHADPEQKMLADMRPWEPYPLSAVLEKWDRRHADGPPHEPTFVPFSIDSLATGELIGGCVLWDLDQHNRNAHLGLALLPSARGQGYGTDVVRVLCDYAFRVLGLHRAQLETMERNTAMRKAALATGFREEGISRGTGWMGDGWENDVVYGLLAREWRSLRSEAQTHA